ARSVQAIMDARGGELTPAELLALFREQYLDVDEPLALLSYVHEAAAAGTDTLRAHVRLEGAERELEGGGNGPIAALVHALGEQLGVAVSVRDFHEHAMSSGEDATAAAYVEADVDEEVVWGVGVHPSIVTASLKAVVNAVDRALAAKARGAAALEAFEAV
ncbi:MAG TPA: alpha-isopropylmalate synthase regulatory domain-containing protein, partial [Gaiellaceae bacterium]|nr:alpha-isopropylmalate synthase regulatory domain-containing protein [Gaiellaceae bacterium]